MMKKRKIMIEDNGQDVLWFVTDEEDKVIDAGPFQRNVWVGSYIPNDMLEVGSPCPIHNPPCIKFGYLKHNVVSREELK